MMECWNIGLVRIKGEKNSLLFLSVNQSFQYSNIPIILAIVKRTLEWSKIIFGERNGFWATALEHRRASFSETSV